MASSNHQNHTLMSYKFSPYYYQKDFIRQWPFADESFDRTATLTTAEKQALAQWRIYWNEFRKPRRGLLQEAETALQRLIRPLDAALVYYGGGDKVRLIARATILEDMYRRQTTFLGVERAGVA